MEKRFYQGVSLLLILLGLSIFVTWGIRKIHEPAQMQLLEASELALEEEPEQAISLARLAHSRWERTRTLTAAVADHAPMDDIDALFAEMEVYAQAEELPHFSACCLQLSKLLRSMYEAHSFTWWNVV